MSHKYLFKFKADTEHKVTQSHQKTQSAVSNILGSRDASPPLLLPINSFENMIQGIDVLHDFEWTHTPGPNRHEVPWIRMSEYKVQFNSLIQNIKYQLSSVGGSFSKLLAAMAGDDQQASKATTQTGKGVEQAQTADKPSGNGNQFNKSQGSLTKLGKWFDGGVDSIDYAKAPEGLPNYLHPYYGLYGTKPSGFEYYFPYFESDWKSTNSDWGNIDSAAGGIAAPLLSIFGEQGTASTFANTSLLNENVLGAYIERPKMFSYGQEGETIKFTITLLNTGNQEDVHKNWQLAYMLTYQNLPSRHSKIFLEPPVIYEVEIPGTFYSPYAYISSLRVVNRGATRLMQVPYLHETPTGKMEVDIPRDFGGGEGEFFRDVVRAHKRTSKFSSKVFVEDKTKMKNRVVEAMIPDAYQINIELKSLIPESKNLFYHSSLGSGTLAGGIYNAYVNPSS